MKVLLPVFSIVVMLATIGGCHPVATTEPMPAPASRPTAIATQPLAKPSAEYSAWVRDGSNPLDYESIIIVNQAGEDGDRDYGHFFSLSASGQVVDMRSYSMSVRGGTGPILDQKTVQDDLQAARQLPPDNGTLPPENRRMVVRFKNEGRMTTRVYDRADPPEQLLKLLDLLSFGFETYVLQIKSIDEIAACPKDDECSVAVSPDGKTIISSGEHSGIKLWEPVTHEYLGGVPALGHADLIAFSPDGKRAVVTDRWENGFALDTSDPERWLKIVQFSKMSGRLDQPAIADPVFTADGRCVLLRSDHNRILARDTQTWEPTDLPAFVPKDCVAYQPQREGEYTVLETTGNGVILWDAQRKRIATLAKGAHLVRSAFSPDLSLVAIIASTPNKLAGFPEELHLALYETRSGRFVHELLPFERADFGRFGQVLWSADGRYVFSNVMRQFGGGSLEVWSVRSGRHRAELGGSEYGVNGFGLLPQLGQIVAGDNGGAIRFWDLTGALKQVDAFERSLENPRAK